MTKKTFSDLDKRSSEVQHQSHNKDRVHQLQVNSSSSTVDRNDQYLSQELATDKHRPGEAVTSSGQFAPKLKTLSGLFGRRRRTSSEITRKSSDKLTPAGSDLDKVKKQKQKKFRDNSRWTDDTIMPKMTDRDREGRRMTDGSGLYDSSSTSESDRESGACRRIADNVLSGVYTKQHKLLPKPEHSSKWSYHHTIPVDLAETASKDDRQKLSAVTHHLQTKQRTAETEEHQKTSATGDHQRIVDANSVEVQNRRHRRCGSQSVTVLSTNHEKAVDAHHQRTGSQPGTDITWYPKYTQQSLDTMLWHNQPTHIDPVAHQPRHEHTHTSHEDPALDCFRQLRGHTNMQHPASGQKCQDKRKLAETKYYLSADKISQSSLNTAHARLGNGYVSGHFVSLRRASTKDTEKQSTNHNSTSARRRMKRSISNEGPSKSRIYEIVEQQDVPTNQPSATSNRIKPTRAKSVTVLGRRSVMNGERGDDSTIFLPEDHADKVILQNAGGAGTLIRSNTSEHDEELLLQKAPPKAENSLRMFCDGLSNQCPIDNSGPANCVGGQEFSQAEVGRSEEALMSDLPQSTLPHQPVATDRLQCEEKQPQRLRTITITITGKRSATGDVYLRSDQYDHLREKSKSHAAGISDDEYWCGGSQKISSSDRVLYPRRRLDSDSGLPPSAREPVNLHRSLSSYLHRHRDQYDFLSEKHRRAGRNWFNPMHVMDSTTVWRNGQMMCPLETTFSAESCFCSTSYASQDKSTDTGSSPEPYENLSSTSVISTPDANAEELRDAHCGQLATHVDGTTHANDHPASFDISTHTETREDLFREQILGTSHLFNRFSMDITPENEQFDFQARMKQAPSENHSYEFRYWSPEVTENADDPTKFVTAVQNPHDVVACAERSTGNPSIKLSERKVNGSRGRLKRRPNAYMTRRRMSNLPSDFSRQGLATRSEESQSQSEDKTEKSVTTLAAPVTIYDYAEVVSFCYPSDGLACEPHDGLDGRLLAPFQSKTLPIGAWEWEFCEIPLQIKEKDIIHYNSVSECVEVKYQEAKREFLRTLASQSRYSNNIPVSMMSTNSRSNMDVSMKSTLYQSTTSYKTLYHDYLREPRPRTGSRSKLTATRGIIRPGCLAAHDSPICATSDFSVRRCAWLNYNDDFSFSIPHRVCDYLTGVLFGIVLVLLLNCLQCFL